MAKTWYAVQHGLDYASDYGSTRKREAFKMAHELCRDHNYDGEEIRICVCTTEDDYCDKKIVIREGNWY